MSEGKVSIDDLSRRIDQLLNVLNMISKDLAEISKALKAVSQPTITIPSTPMEGVLGVEDVKKSFSSDLKEMLTFEETGDHVMITPRGFLGSENFGRIASIVRSLGGEYISAGKNSHFRVPR